MTTDGNADVLNVINLHASALLELNKTHGSVYRTWLQSLEREHRQEWLKLVRGSDCGKGRRRRKQVESLLSQRKKSPKTPTPQDNDRKVSAWDKREGLFVLCTSITVEELASLNCLNEPASFQQATEHLSAQYNFAEAYRRSLRRETRRVRDRILERFECLLFYLNLVLGSFHSGTGWLHGGHQRLLKIQKPPDDHVNAKKRNERMAERGLSYYCWGVYLGDLRNLIRLRADNDVPESLYGDRHHRPRIPYYANQLFDSGLCEKRSEIQTCVDGIVPTWPVIPKTVTLQLINSLMQGENWNLLSCEAKRNTEERIDTTLETFYPNNTRGSDGNPGGMPQELADHPSPTTSSSMHGNKGGSSLSLDAERHFTEVMSAGNEMLPASNALESDSAWCPVPDLMYGSMFTTFMEPSYGNVFSDNSWSDHDASNLFGTHRMDP